MAEEHTIQISEEDATKIADSRLESSAMLDGGGIEGRGLHRIVAKDITDLDDERIFYFIHPSEILFGFNATAASRGLFIADWRTKYLFQDPWIHLCTVDGIYRTGKRAIKELYEEFPAILEPANHGLVVNVHRIRWIELTSKIYPMLGFSKISHTPTQTNECLIQSRNCAKKIRKRLGIRWG